MIKVFRAGFRVVVLCLVLSATTVLAQSGRGTVTGRVTDSSGGVLPGAFVTLSPSGGSAVTDQQGEYTIAALAAGAYTLNVNYVGFSVFAKDLNVAAGQAVRIDATLQVSAEQMTAARGGRRVTSAVAAWPSES